LGLISDSQTSRAWTPDASAILYEKYWKLHGGVEAISNRADGVGNSLLALGAQYGWQLAGMMLIGAALMRSGWLKGQFSLRHYRRTGFVLVAIGVTINLPAIALQWQLDWAYRWCAFLLQMPRELSAPFQAIGYASLFYGFWPQLSRFKLVLAIACVGRMALTNYLLQTLICTTLFYHLSLFMQFNHRRLTARHVRRASANPAFRRNNILLFQRTHPACFTHGVIFNAVAGRKITNTLMTVIQQHARRHSGTAEIIQANATMGVPRHNAVD
jgi:uncharacterized protein